MYICMMGGRGSVACSESMHMDLQFQYTGPLPAYKGVRHHGEFWHLPLENLQPSDANLTSRLGFLRSQLPCLLLVYCFHTAVKLSECLPVGGCLGAGHGLLQCTQMQGLSQLASANFADERRYTRRICKALSVVLFLVSGVS